MASNQGSVRDKRAKNFFEVIFDPSDTADYPPSTWDFTKSSTKFHVTLDAYYFNTEFGLKQQVLSCLKFEKCDFFGDFCEFKPSFKNCDFYKCDFGLTNWRKARFKRCRFHKCSFSLASFEYCEFRDCDFSEISFSGNETVLIGTLFNNPEKFVCSGYTNLNPADIKEFAPNTNVSYQRMRLEGTKATIARIIMSNLSSAGDEQSYYEAVKTYQNTLSDFKIRNEKYELFSKPGFFVKLRALRKLMTFWIEKYSIKLAGIVNNWGASIARPMLLGLIIIVAFSVIYYITELRPNLSKSIMTSLDVTLLIGYTKHASYSDTGGKQMLYAINMLLGLVWYSIFIPTVINRISRVR